MNPYIELCLIFSQMRLFGFSLGPELFFISLFFSSVTYINSCKWNLTIRAQSYTIMCFSFEHKHHIFDFYDYTWNFFSPFFLENIFSHSIELVLVPHIVIAIVYFLFEYSQSSYGHVLFSLDTIYVLSISSLNHITCLQELKVKTSNVLWPHIIK